MKKLFLLSVFFGLVLAPAASAGPTENYIALKLGLASTKANERWDGGKSEIKGLPLLGLAGGCDFNPVRAEFEYTWRGKKEFIADDKLEIGVQSLFLNFYYDIDTPSPVIPYVGAGLGLAKIAAEISRPQKVLKTKTNFGWNIGGGAAWRFNDMVSLDLGYRYAGFGGIGIPGKPNQVKVNAHEMLLGLRFIPDEIF